MGNINVLAGGMFFLPALLSLSYLIPLSDTYVSVYPNAAEYSLPGPSNSMDTLLFCTALGNAELPASNQVHLGEAHPGATRCSAHIWTTYTVADPCGGDITYDVRIIPGDSGSAVQLIAPTMAVLDQNNTVELSFDTRASSLPADHPVALHGLPYTGKSCGVNAYHRMVWTIVNACDETTEVEYLLRIDDCRKPTPVCVGLSSVVVPGTGDIMIWARDFNSMSFDDCTTVNDLLFSFSGDSYVPSKDIECEEICLHTGMTLLQQIWVADAGVDANCNGTIEWEERNKDFCTTFIAFDDTPNICECFQTYGGYIRRPNGSGIPDVTVNFSNDFVTEFTITNEHGWYSRALLFFNPLLPITITPERNINHREGVSTLDLVILQKHLLGIELIANPYQHLAGDVNKSGSLSALDLVEIRKLILGLIHEFPNNKSWRFIPATYMLGDTTHPGPIPEEVLANINEPLVDFIGVKIGDLSGSATNLQGSTIETRNTRQPLILRINDRLVQTGEVIDIPVYAGHSANILGFQLTLNTQGLQLLDVQQGILHITRDCMAAHHEAIAMSWFDVRPVSIMPNAAMFTLSFIAEEDGLLNEMLGISSEITKAEAYLIQAGSTSVADVSGVALVFTPAHQHPDEVTLHQNIPNPFSGGTSVVFELPEVTQVAFTIYDIHGRIVHRIQGIYSADMHQLNIAAGDLPHVGMYIYRLQADGYDITRKMMRME